MTFKDQMTSDLSVFFNTDEFADTVSYTSIDDIAKDITIVPTRSNPFQEPYVRGEETATCEIEVKKSEVTHPQYGDIFTIPSRVWAYDATITTESEVWEFDPVRGIISQDDDTYLIGLVRRD
ncbi:MAG: hypothetical protein WBC22_09675 [Sedimentisphaerales bacterium]